jgi:hypothetical protein
LHSGRPAPSTFLARPRAPILEPSIQRLLYISTALKGYEDAGDYVCYESILAGTKVRLEGEFFLVGCQKMANLTRRGLCSALCAVAMLAFGFSGGEVQADSDSKGGRHHSRSRSRRSHSSHDHGGGSESHSRRSARKGHGTSASEASNNGSSRKRRQHRRTVDRDDEDNDFRRSGRTRCRRPRRDVACDREWALSGF